MSIVALSKIRIWVCIDILAGSVSVKTKIRTRNSCTRFINWPLTQNTVPQPLKGGRLRHQRPDISTQVRVPPLLLPVSGSVAAGAPAVAPVRAVSGPARQHLYLTPGRLQKLYFYFMTYFSYFFLLVKA